MIMVVVGVFVLVVLVVVVGVALSEDGVGTRRWPVEAVDWRWSVEAVEAVAAVPGLSRGV
jgi:hypothetical protein